MDRNKLCKYILGPLSQNDCTNIIKEYCLSNNKDANLTDTFINLVLTIDFLYNNILFELTYYILDKEAIEQNIIKIYNKNQQLIKVF